MSWNSKMTATDKAKMIMFIMIIEDILSKIKFPLPRGAFAYREKPEWYQ